MGTPAARLLLGGTLGLLACKPNLAPTSPPHVAPASLSAGLVADAAPVRDWGEVWEVKSTRFADLVPADSAMVWVNEGPLPDHALEVLEPFVTPILATMHNTLRKKKSKGARWALEQIGPTLDGDALRRFGIDPNPRVLLYVHGLAPVIRVSLSDPDKFAEVLRGDVGDNATLSNFHGQEFWELTMEDDDDSGAPMFGALAISGGDLVLATFPVGFEDDLLPLIFGQRLPKQRLWDTGFITQAEQEFGLLPHYLFRIDLRMTLALVYGNAGGRNQAIASAMSQIQEDDCDQDMLRLAESIPALYWGVRRFGEDSLDTAFALDIDDEAAAALSQLAGKIPGLTKSRERGESLAAGLGFDFAGVEPFLEVLAEGLRQRPFNCEAMSGLNQLTDAPVLLQAAPDELRSFTGASVIVHDVEGFVLGEGPAYAVLGFEDPLKALSGSIATSAGFLVDRIKRGRITKLRDAAPTAANSDALEDANMTRGPTAVAIGNRSTPNATLLNAVGLQRRKDGTLMMLRWDLAQWSADHPNAAGLDELEPLARELAEAMLSSLQRGSIALRAAKSGLVLDVSLARPTHATASPAKNRSRP